MARELNEQQEKFCQNYVLNGNAAAAARTAGYAIKHASASGYQLLKNPLIQERIEELQATMTTEIDVINEAENQYREAVKSGNQQTALKSLELLSRVRGASPDELFLDAGELEKKIIKALEVLGKERVDKLIKKCEFD